MKFSPFLLPLGVTIAGGIWLAVQTHGIDRLEAREMELKRRLVQGRPLVRGTERAEAVRPRVTLPLRKEGGPDWLLMANGKIGDLEELAPLLDQQLLGMTPAELLAEYARLGEVADPEWRDELEAKIGRVLAMKDPQLALETFRDKIAARGGWTDLLAEALLKVTARDPEQAIRWFDQVAAEGGFSDRRIAGMSNRDYYEASLAAGLLKSHPARAAERLMAIPEGLRANVFNQPQLKDIAPELKPAAAGLWKQVLSPEEQEAQLKARIGVASPGSKGNVNSIDEWLNAAGCDPADKAKLMSGCSEYLVSDAMYASAADGEKCVAELNDWALRETPEAAAQVMASALEAMLEAEDPEKAADFIAQLSGGAAYRDRLLAGLLTSGRIQLPGVEENLSARISDAALRESVRKKLRGEDE